MQWVDWDGGPQGRNRPYDIKLYTGTCGATDSAAGSGRPGQVGHGIRPTRWLPWAAGRTANIIPDYVTGEQTQEQSTRENTILCCHAVPRPPWGRYTGQARGQRPFVDWGAGRGVFSTKRVVSHKQYRIRLYSWTWVSSRAALYIFSYPFLQWIAMIMSFSLSCSMSRGVVWAMRLRLMSIGLRYLTAVTSHSPNWQSKHGSDTEKYTISISADSRQLRPEFWTFNLYRKARRNHIFNVKRNAAVDIYGYLVRFFDTKNSGIRFVQVHCELKSVCLQLEAFRIRYFYHHCGRLFRDLSGIREQNKYRIEERLRKLLRVKYCCHRLKVMRVMNWMSWAQEDSMQQI